MKTQYQDTRDALNGTQGRKNDNQKYWRVLVDGTNVYQSSSKRSATAKARHIRDNFAFGREVTVE